MKKIKYIALVLLGCLNLSSCNQDNQDNQIIESELKIYFLNFESAANAHGLDIDISTIDIEGYIRDIETKGTIGQCHSYSDGSQKIILDQEYWYRISGFEREYLVFHELGHCVLDKKHNDEKDENGNCISIMQSGTGNCLGTYNIENRKQLLFELFSI